MTIPLEWIDTICKKDSIDIVHKLGERLDIGGYALYGFLIRIGIKYTESNTNWINKKPCWYLGFMFFWFAIFFCKNDDANEHDETGRSIPGSEYTCTGIKLFWGPRKYQPGQIFWNHEVRLGKVTKK